jgi:uncharacterized protein YejL (UPF0352 family)
MHKVIHSRHAAKTSMSRIVLRVFALAATPVARAQRKALVNEFSMALRKKLPAKGSWMI